MYVAYIQPLAKGEDQKIMSNYSWRKGQSRGPNSIVADSQKTVSDDGVRSAIGRNYKAEGKQPGTYTGVRLWTLKEKLDGKWQVIHERVSRERAVEWVGKEVA